MFIEKSRNFGFDISIIKYEFWNITTQIAVYLLGIRGAAEKQKEQDGRERHGRHLASVYLLHECISAVL